MRIPSRWLNYSESGQINGTRFVVFKTPLRKNFNSNLLPGISFSPSDLLKKHPKVKLVIDLTNTFAYYNGVEEFQSKGVQYKKIKCKGVLIPSEEVYKEFARVVDEFIEKNPEDYLIGVHCTHGVNRTGYLTARYMIDRLGYEPDQAIKEFYVSRGHPIERTNYIEDLRKMKEPQCKNVNPQQSSSNPNPVSFQTIPFQNR